MTSNNSQEVIDHSEIKTASELLAAMRQGKDLKYYLKFGKIKIPCRVLSAFEEVEALRKAKLRAKEKAGENPDHTTLKTYESVFIMQSTLFRATSINGDVGFSESELAEMASEELQFLYDQYCSLGHLVNPEFEQIAAGEIKNMIMNVKKKSAKPSDFFTWQLAAVGKFFLEEIIPILPEDSEVGS